MFFFTSFSLIYLGEVKQQKHDRASLAGLLVLRGWENEEEEQEKGEEVMLL